MLSEHVVTPQVKAAAIRELLHSITVPREFEDRFGISSDQAKNWMRQLADQVGRKAAGMERATGVSPAELRLLLGGSDGPLL